MRPVSYVAVSHIYTVLLFRGFPAQKGLPGIFKHRFQRVDENFSFPQAGMLSDNVKMSKFTRLFTE